MNFILKILRFLIFYDKFKVKDIYSEIVKKVNKTSFAVQNKKLTLQE